MKKIMYFWLAALLLPAFVACQDGKKAAGQIDWQDDELLAVAFLGYYDSVGAFESSPSYSRLTQTFPQIVEASVAGGGGRELYLVVPRDPMASVAVDGGGEEAADGAHEALYRSGEGKPVLVLCNASGADRVVSCKDGAGRTATFVPRTEPRTATLAVPADGSVHDISPSQPRPLEGFTAFDCSDGSPDGGLGVSVRLEGGQPVLTCTAAALEELGLEGDSSAFRAGDSYFSGINGLCKGVFIGTIGQDDNPVVCVVMGNGDVKMCGVFYAIRHGGLHLSGALPGFKDVTGFESGGGGPWEDKETGETDFDYVTIYALDARGGRTEIPYCLDYGDYTSESGNDSYVAAVTPDWRFTLTHISRDIGLLQVYEGEFVEAGEEDGARVYPFRLVRYSRFEGDGAERDESVRTGTFNVRGAGPYEVDVTGADVFPDGTVFRRER